VGAGKAMTWKRMIEGSVHLYTLYGSEVPSRQQQQQQQPLLQQGQAEQEQQQQQLQLAPGV